jgi:hypothetical protein
VQHLVGNGKLPQLQQQRESRAAGATDLAFGVGFSSMLRLELLLHVGLDQHVRGL